MASDDYLTVSLDFQYDTKPVLKDVNFKVSYGSTLGVLGSNGAGKTTLLKCLTGLNRTTNMIEWHPKPNGQLPTMGALVESPAFTETMTVEEHLKMIQRWRGQPNLELDNICLRLKLDTMLQTPLNSMSLGQRQRVGIARALLSKPDVLILDEPTNGLDPQGIADIRVLIQELAAEGYSIILASHLLSEVLQCCSQILVLNHGEIQYYGSLNDLESTTGCIVNSPRPELLTSYLQAASIEYHTHRDGYHLPNVTDVPSMNKMLVEQGVPVSRIHPFQSNVEQTLLKYMGQQ